ncbi:MAG: hypothetical protein OXH69_03525 [Acidobacteria bacterium]|nr:hypothetical protein [Acidobacteriota bacterium]
MALYQTTRLDPATMERLRALAARTGQSLADLVRTWSYADVDTVLRVHGMRTAAEARAMERRARTTKGHNRERKHRPVVEGAGPRLLLRERLD